MPTVAAAVWECPRDVRVRKREATAPKITHGPSDGPRRRVNMRNAMKTMQKVVNPMQVALPSRSPLKLMDEETVSMVCLQFIKPGDTCRGLLRVTMYRLPVRVGLEAASIHHDIHATPISTVGGSVLSCIWRLKRGGRNGTQTTRPGGVVDGSLKVAAGVHSRGRPRRGDGVVRRRDIRDNVDNLRPRVALLHSDGEGRRYGTATMSSLGGGDAGRLEGHGCQVVVDEVQ